MLKITIPAIELYDEVTNTFVYSKEQNLQLEHSLVSISKWESKWCVPFLTKKEKTVEETIDYIKCMTTNQNVDEQAYKLLTNDDIRKVRQYIEAPMTATVFGKGKGAPNREIITSELIYYWMTALHIPFECQKWHLNRLLTLINIANLKNTPPQKMSKQEIMRRNADLNAQRKRSMNTKG